MTFGLLSQDSFLNGRVTLFQPKKGYRAAIDPVFLAAGIPACPSDKVLEIGSGTGAASFCLAARVPKVEVLGLELQLDLVELATKSVELNSLNKTVSFLQGDLLSPPERIGAFLFDHVMANPPHLKRQSVISSPNLQKEIAYVEGEAALADWIKFALRNVRVGGTITFLHRYDRRDEIVSGLEQSAGGIIIFPLWPKIRGKGAKRAIVQGRKGIRGKTKLATGIVLYDDKGKFSTEANRILREADRLKLKTTC
jgi:tRNA1(Val) A37 N6-methylase TrmN6